MADLLVARLLASQDPHRGPIRVLEAVGQEVQKEVWVRALRRKLVSFLFLCSFIFGVSAVIDFLLWVFMQFYVPCWTIAVLSGAFMLLTLALARLIGGEEDV